jgi:hypothetical protein
MGGEKQPEPVVRQSAKIENELGQLEKKLNKFGEEAHN